MTTATVTHKNTEYRFYTESEFLPIRRQLFAEGWHKDLACGDDGSWAGTALLAAYLAKVDAFPEAEIVTVYRDAK